MLFWVGSKNAFAEVGGTWKVKVLTSSVGYASLALYVVHHGSHPSLSVPHDLLYLQFSAKKTSTFQGPILQVMDANPVVKRLLENIQDL